MKRTIIITGATGKFGKAFVKYFLKSGDNVIAIGKSKKSLNYLKSQNTNNSKSLFLIKVNLMDLKSIDIIVKTIKKKQT